MTGISGLGLKISQIFPKFLGKTLLDFQWLLLAGLPIDQMLLPDPQHDPGLGLSLLLQVGRAWPGLGLQLPCPSRHGQSRAVQ